MSVMTRKLWGGSAGRMGSHDGLKWLITMVIYGDRKSLTAIGVIPLPNGLFMVFVTFVDFWCLGFLFVDTISGRVNTVVVFFALEK